MWINNSESDRKEKLKGNILVKHRWESQAVHNEQMKFQTVSYDHVRWKNQLNEESIGGSSLMNFSTYSSESHSMSLPVYKSSCTNLDFTLNWKITALADYSQLSIFLTQFSKRLQGPAFFKQKVIVQRLKRGKVKRVNWPLHEKFSKFGWFLFWCVTLTWNTLVLFELTPLTPSIKLLCFSLRC